MAADPYPGEAGPSRPARRDLPPQVPASTVTIGLWLFLAALFMLFAAGLLGYLIVRLRGSSSPPLGSLHLPSILWLSTAMVIGVSVTLFQALRYLRIERQKPFLLWLQLSLALAVGFILVQAPALWDLLQERRREQRVALYGLLFFLILLHALHVVGGIICLIVVTLRARQNRYDHEHYLPIRHVSMYWHFLDVVWIVMFLTFLATR